MTKKIFAYAFLALVLLFVYAPIFVLIVFSFTDTTIIGQWDGFSLELYRELFTDPKLRSMIVNTLVLAALRRAFPPCSAPWARSVCFTANAYGKNCSAGRPTST